MTVTNTPFASAPIVLSTGGMYYKNETENIIEQDGVLLYPNPATNTISIASELCFSNYSVTNAIGQTLLAGNTAQKCDFDVNIAELPSGIYFLVLQHPTTTKTMRFVKQ
jgi:hypothetical protein